MSKAYFLVNMAEKFRQYGCREAVKDLQAIPEVKSVQRVSGICDLLVQVEVPVKVILVANKIMAKEWVKQLHVLKVASIELDRYESTTDELLKSGATPIPPTEAYFMVNVPEKFRQYGCREAVKDLQTIPEVKSVETISGVCDLLVQVAAPVKVLLKDNKIMAKEWVKQLHVLKVVSMELDRHESTTDELLTTQKIPISWG